jgi:hypothetical protein
MLSQFIRFIKRLLKCGICKETIELEDKYIILNKKCRCECIIPYKDIRMILYTIKNKNSYLLIVKLNENWCSLYNKVFLDGVKIKSDSDTIVKATNTYKRSLSIVPTIMPCNIPMVDRNDHSIFQYSFLFKRGLLEIINIDNDSITISEMFSDKHKNINFNEIFKLLKDYNVFFEDDTLTGSEKYNFKIAILDKAFTLGRGYGLYPIFNNEIILEDIFYSFDKQEIKTKLIQLFDNKPTQLN